MREEVKFIFWERVFTILYYKKLQMCDERCTDEGYRSVSSWCHVVARCLGVKPPFGNSPGDELKAL